MGILIYGIVELAFYAVKKEINWISNLRSAYPPDKPRQPARAVSIPFMRRLHCLLDGRFPQRKSRNSNMGQKRLLFLQARLTPASAAGGPGEVAGQTERLNRASISPVRCKPCWAVALAT